MTTNPDRHPERIAATVRENNTLRGYRYTTHGDADANGNRVYVREDVAEAAREAAVTVALSVGGDSARHFERLLTERVERLRDLESEGHFLRGKVHELDALRRERDALRLVARRAGEVLEWVAEVLPDKEYVDPGCIAALNKAIDDAKAAGTGVG